MKALRFTFGAVLLLALAGGAWVVTLHSDWLRPAANEAEEKPPEPEVPVATAKVERATLHQYVDAFGTIEPAPASASSPGAGASLTSPVPGVVAAVKCSTGERVNLGDVLVQLDDRVARALEEQATAALESAKATLNKVKSIPRPEQLQLGQLVVDKARSGLAFAEKSFDRQRILSENNAVSQKSLELSQSELASARNQLKVAEMELAILKASPTPEELAEATAKVAEAERALAAARVQRSMLAVVAPVPATVTRVGVNVGEAVDATRVLVELVDENRLVAMVAVPAGEADAVQPGQRAFVMDEAGAALRSSSATRPASTRRATMETPSGEVRVVGPGVDRKTDSVWTVVAFPAAAALKSGRTVHVRVVVAEHPDRLAVPRESVVTTADGQAVIYKVDGDKASQVPVRVGFSEEDLVEVEADAIRVGDSVVTAGAYGLPPKTKVRAIQ